jgi:para-nitrobenzyl esterase
MSDYWVNFARTGDPNSADLPEWPRFDDGIPSVLKIRENDIIPVMIPNNDKLDFWNGIFNKE